MAAEPKQEYIALMPLLSRNHLRIWRPWDWSTGKPVARPMASVTMKTLTRMGWVPYTGPAITDERGWIVDTKGDLMVQPKRPDTLDPYDRRH